MHFSPSHNDPALLQFDLPRMIATSPVFSSRALQNLQRNVFDTFLTFDHYPSQIYFIALLCVCFRSMNSIPLHIICFRSMNSIPLHTICFRSMNSIPLHTICSRFIQFVPVSWILLRLIQFVSDPWILLLFMILIALYEFYRYAGLQSRFTNYHHGRRYEGIWYLMYKAVISSIHLLFSLFSYSTFPLVLSLSSPTNLLLNPIKPSFFIMELRVLRKLPMSIIFHKSLNYLSTNW